MSNIVKKVVNVTKPTTPTKAVVGAGDIGAVSAVPVSAVSVSNFMRVYRKKSTFKDATPTDFWYSGTRADGLSVICNFKCDITTDSSAFEISNIIGNVKTKTEKVKGIEYTNLTYYIISCDFTEIEGEPLPL